MTLLTTIMYHYVRPISESRYPGIKGLELSDFRGQLDHVQAHYTVLSPAELRDVVINGGATPPRPCVLTFDDGYTDHYEYVFPELLDRGLSGFFFAPRSSLVDRDILNVNRIQFALACHPDPAGLADELDTLLVDQGGGDPEVLRADHFKPNRYDTAPVAYTKRLLQHALAPDVRDRLARVLFQRHVSADERGFADELYLTVDQAKEMCAHGMEFGGHGDAHLWHGLCDETALQSEINGSVSALRGIDQMKTQASYCYPFGSQNDRVRHAASATGFGIGFTVVPELWRLSGDPLQISRLDTNDVPREPTATCPWLKKVS